MLDREVIASNAEDDARYDDNAATYAVNYTVQEIISGLRRKAGEYEDNRLFTAASALKQFANELEQS